MGSSRLHRNTARRWPDGDRNEFRPELHVDGGGGFRFSPDSATSRPGNDSSNGYANVNASGYFDRTLYGYFGVGVRDRSDSANQLTSLLLPSV